MDREIKFEAYAPAQKTMLTWGQIKSIDFKYNEDKSLVRVTGYEYGSFVIHNDYLRQYTGLKDSEGNELYSGDILEFCFEGVFNDYYKTGVMTEDTFNGGYLIESGAVGLSLSHPKLDLKDIKIIGNKFENPELLTKEEAE